MKKITLFLLLTFGFSQNSSLEFDGVDDYVEIPNSENYVFNTMTVNAWVKSRNHLQVDEVAYVNRFSGDEDAWGLGKNINAGLFYHIKTTDCWTVVVGGLDHLPVEEWVYITGSYDGTNAKLYVNGQLISSEECTGSIQDTNIPIGIGSDYIGTMPLDGNVDEVTIWNTALTQAEIQSYMSTPPTGSENGLVGYWNFNEGSGTTLTDQTANGNDGIINGATWSMDVPEVVYGCTDSQATNYDETAHLDNGSCTYPDAGDYSLNFENDSYVTIPFSDNLDFGENVPMSISFWIIQSSSEGTHILGKRYGQNDCTFQIGAGDGLISIGGYPGGWWDELTIPSPTITEAWTHVVFTFDGDMMSGYINGILEGSSSGSSLGPRRAIPIEIGTLQWGQTHDLFDGLIDEVGIWNRALTQEEVHSYMVTPPTGSESGLVGYWNFNEGAGTTVYDATSNSNNGTIINDPQWSTDVPVHCFDNDAAVAALGDCAGAIVSLDCETLWGGIPLSEICPVSCDACLEVYGCTDLLAYNYNPAANVDDGSCVYGGDCSYALGDINGDESWNIQDIVILINCVLLDNCDEALGENICAGDINGDESWNIQDIVILINCVLLDECDEVLDNGDDSCDDCGVCDSDSLNDNTTCSQDCAGIWGGGAVVDDCGVCGGDGSSCADCAGTPNGDAVLDNCGTCDSDSSNDCVQDCAGVWGGTAAVDECGCTDSNAINYNSAATFDDGSCINFETQIAGCISSLNAGNNVTLQAKAVNNSSVTITISGIMLLNNENLVIFIQELNTAFQPNYYFTYNMSLPNPSSGNAFEYISGGYKILWQFDYEENTYQNIYDINGIGGC